MECKESKSSSTVLGVSCEAEEAGPEADPDPLLVPGGAGGSPEVFAGKELALTVVASPLVMTVMLLLLEVELELTLLS